MSEDALLPSEISQVLPLGPNPTIEALRRLSIRNLEQALLASWVLHYTQDHAGYPRTLAVLATREASSTALGCRAWLMKKESRDLGVCVTLLSALESDVVRYGSWDDALGLVVLGFLRDCLDHDHISVRSGVLAVLARATEAGALSFSLPAARWLAIALPPAVSHFADDDEQADLDIALRGLEQPHRRPDPTRPLSRLALDLADVLDRHEGSVRDCTPLVDFVRREELYAHADGQARHAQRSLLTYRVLADSVPTTVLRALVNFGEAIVALGEKPDFDDPTTPDYGTSFAWAPAASLPLHFYFHGEGAQHAHDVLQGLVDAARSPKKLRALVEEMDPAVARTLLSLVAQLSKHTGSVEVILSDASSPWQDSLVISADVLGSSSLTALSRISRGRAREQGVVVHKDFVPQANTVRQVFQAVDAMLQKGLVSPDDIDDVNNQRQVNYYKQGARILGLFDEDNIPTSRAASLQGRRHQQRLAITSIYFEDSPIGRAWRRWAGKVRLVDVDPTSAEEFLLDTVVGLSGTTPGRRASTLRTWFSELMEHYPRG